MTPNTLQQITDSYQNDYDNKFGYQRLSNVARLKQSEPISLRLNKFIEARFNRYSQNFNIVFTDVDDFDSDDIDGTFQRHVDRFVNENTIHIWTGASDDTIFGDAKINHYFRAWHDVEHLINRLGYSYLDESIVCEIQKSQLPDHWVFEKDLIHAEITGQAQYFMHNGTFVPNQRVFTRDYISSPKDALKIRF